MLTTTRPRKTAVPLLVALVVLLTGCSGGGSESDAGAGVSSIAGQATHTPPSQAGADARRPQLRVDTTEAEKARLLTVWGKCLKGQGVPTYEKDGGKLVLTEAKPSEYAAQFAACADKEPVYPAALDPQRNPHYADDMREWVACTNEKSPTLKVVQTDDGPRPADDAAYNNASDEAQKQFAKVQQNCQYEAFGRE